MLMHMGNRDNKYLPNSAFDLLRQRGDVCEPCGEHAKLLDEIVDILIVLDGHLLVVPFHIGDLRHVGFELSVKKRKKRKKIFRKSVACE